MKKGLKLKNYFMYQKSLKTFKIVWLTLITQLIASSVVSQVPTTTLPKTMITFPNFSFNNNRPVCVVLIHGITNSPTTSQRLIEERKAPNRPVNSLKFARHYWSYEFVQGLFNLTTDKIYTFSDGSLNGELNAFASDWETKLTNNTVATDHILTGAGIPGSTGPAGVTGFLTVMMTYRDGSLSLKKQTAAAALQIKTLYKNVFGSWPEDKQPQLILLCHSGGGLVARTICTRPASLGGGTSSLLDSPIPIETFSQTENSNMEFVRSRTLYIVTLSTPHEGAPVAKVANQLGNHVSSIGLAFATFGWGNPFQSVTDQDPQIPILKELCPNILKDYNLGPLNPANCKRSDGSLIPIYCLGGRAATGPFFYNDPNQYDANSSTADGGILFSKDDIKKEGRSANGAAINNRREYESYGLLQADYITTLLYGITSVSMAAPELLSSGIAGKSTGFELRLLVTPTDNTELDIVKIRNNGLFGCLDPAVYNLIDFSLGAKLFYLRRNWQNIMESVGGTALTKCSGRYRDNGASTSGDGLIDCDGFVPIISSLGVNLGTNTKNYFSNVQNGSWYRFYRSGADYDHHGSIMQRIEVSTFIRQNIIGITSVTNLLNGGIPSGAAGPYISTGVRSTWTR